MKRVERLKEMKGAEELNESDEDGDLPSVAQHYAATAGAPSRNRGGGQEGREGGGGVGEAGGAGEAREESLGDPKREVSEVNPCPNSQYGSDTTCWISVGNTGHVVGSDIRLWSRLFSGTFVFLECVHVPIDDT